MHVAHEYPVSAVGNKYTKNIVVADSMITLKEAIWA